LKPPRLTTASTELAYSENRMKGCGSFHAPSAPFRISQGLPVGLTYFLLSSSSR